jgi:hypothetical protein
MSLPIQTIGTLIQQLLSGQYAPTGIGTNPPARLGPDPNRVPTSVLPGFQQGQANLDIMSLLAPYFGLLSSSGTNPAAGGPPATAPGGDLLTQILTSLLSPAAPSNPVYSPAGPASSPTPSPTSGTAGSGEGGSGGGGSGSTSGGGDQGGIGNMGPEGGYGGNMFNA